MTEDNPHVSMEIIAERKRITSPWVRNKADERAVVNGCWWDWERAAFAIWWIERNMVLYEGAYDGKPLILHSIADEPDWPDLPVFYEEDGTINEQTEAVFKERFRWHNQAITEKYPMHWQFEVHARLYGWQKHSKRWEKHGINQIRRFSRGIVWIPKKNAKTPTAAANVLYLTAGDGEPGNKVFIAAKDGGQAGIAWMHCHKMLQKSPGLIADAHVNGSTKRVLFNSSSSFFEPLSSSNKRVQRSKEGLNGSIVVDECHVVDREFMSILKYAGASRVQPMQIGYSTAGDNPDGWGKEQWDYGESVNAGDATDDTYFHASWHVPQNLTVEEFGKDPERYIRMANPSLGHTVDLEELLPAWESAKNSSYEAARFLMYRCNKWMSTSNAWLNPGVWAGCGGWKFNKSDLIEIPAVIGLDLARKFDLASAVITWPNELGSVDLKPFFWCNEDRIRNLIAHVPKLSQWAEAGLIRVNPGNVTDFRIVEKDLRDICEEWNIAGIVYDATYAEILIQHLVDGVEGLYDPLSIGEQAMSQGMLTQTAPTTDFENDLKAGKIRHEDNPVLAWQMSHANVREDSRGNISVEKEDRKSFRTVDGVQAAIMSRWGSLDFDGFETGVFNYYEKNELESI